MSKRLQLLYEMLPKSGRGIIDVGTDHGSIPVKLALSDYDGNIFAADIAKKPLHSAYITAKDAKADHRIQFLLCDGLEGCPPDAIDCILIAGMGGDTICGILDRAEWLFDSPYQLVLQPMTKQEVLRYWLVHNEFKIEREGLVSEEGHIYQMFSACPGKNVRMTDAEYMVGCSSAIRIGEPASLSTAHQLLIIEKKLRGLGLTKQTDSPEYLFFQNIKNELVEMSRKLGEENGER